MEKKCGLALLWQEDINLEILNYSNSHITSKIRDFDFYGQPDTCKRLESWNLSNRINKEPDMSWCVLDDFNEIVTQDEKLRGRSRPRKQMDDFKLALETNGCVDLGWRN